MLDGHSPILTVRTNLTCHGRNWFYLYSICFVHLVLECVFVLIKGYWYEVQFIHCIGVRCLSICAYAALSVFLQRFWKVSTVLAKERVRWSIFAYNGSRSILRGNNTTTIRGSTSHFSLAAAAVGEIITTCKANIASAPRDCTRGMRVRLEMCWCVCVCLLLTAFERLQDQ